MPTSFIDRKRRNAALLALALAALPTLAAAGTPFADRYTTRWTRTGRFTLQHYGTLANGTVCPPSPNAFRDSIDQAGPEYVHSYGVSPKSDPDASAVIEARQSCTVVFSGEVLFSWHLARHATIIATSAFPLGSSKQGGARL